MADAIPLHAISYSRGAIPRGDELLEKRLERIVELRESNRDLKDVYDALYERVSGLRNTAILYKDSGKAVEDFITIRTNALPVIGSWGPAVARRARASAIGFESPSTAKNGAHSARITFCKRCAVNR